MEQYGFIIVLAPLLGAAINGFLGKYIQKRSGERAVGLIANASVFISFCVALAAFAAVWSAEEDAHTVVCYLFNWLNVGALRADVSLLFDPLSAVMVLVITGIGFLIHIYSTGYMKGDPGCYRFFAYLNLFIFAMLILVLGENMLLMFIGWEGVGLCSYLLISFWFTKQANAQAGNKAFIVNRIGDFGFILGMLVLYSLLRESVFTGGLAGVEAPSLLSFRFLEMNIHLLTNTELFGISAATLVCLCLFVGAAGKSAQIPLYVWLPDAMAGPTPVSALIHAATMVTAGIYMIGRLHFLFSMSAAALQVIAVIGAATALFAATIGCVQNDIKKVLAYSTVSQLGYMFLGMGVAAYSAGIFHLMTHAFFKACLFLGSGSVILGMRHEQDIRWMGGLKKYMPRTFATFLIATLALSGLPPFSGFFSKDEILWQAWKTGHHGLWLMGFISAGITAFYMTRLVILTFYGLNRLHLRPSQDLEHDHDNHDHGRHDVRESPASITAPLIILAFFSLVAGFIGIPAALGGGNRFEHFLVPVFGHHASAPHHDPMEYLLMFASVTVALAGIAAGVFFYRIRPELPDKIVSRIKTFHRIVYNKYYVDEIYGVIFVSGTKLLAKASAAFDRYVIDLLVDLAAYVLRVNSYLSGAFDRIVVDGLVNGAASSFLFSGEQLRRLQTGKIQAYVMLLLFLIVIGVSFAVIM
ncbi:MAG: NADH-quinone oxidoreductase subunit L [Nitrospira bacterium HGW-Nitrospira-1]|nr:MAG: NADH-quinone oxidoreductase subunit L [Nitrospira bacterium HGW-Nitrospira-1]